MKKARLSPFRFPGLYGPESALKLGYYNQGEFIQRAGNRIINEFLFYFQEIF